MQNAERSDEFGRLLQEFRLRAGLTQEALAERAGLGRRSVQALERGESGPQRATVQRLAQAFGLSPSERTRFEAAARPSPRFRVVDASRPIRVLPVARSEAMPHHNLPAQLTSFVGREEEIREISSLLATKRLVTLTGTGGCGKTRLAYQVAAEILGTYPDGVWRVELAALADPALVSKAIANSLGLPERPDRSVLHALTVFLQNCHCLLVLDNCEHLIDACAQVAASLIQECPKLTILATSRQALQVLGEVQWHVPSLPTPNLASLASASSDHTRVVSEYPAIQLFVERARAVQPTFALTSQNLLAVARIVWHLDGMPLAIELAAARVHALTVASIADRLDERFQLLTTGNRVALPRQQTLRATIDWSYNLLTELDRVLLRRLAVFTGGFALEAVEGICVGDGLAVEDVLPALVRLVDQSLVEVASGEGTARYRILETIREYAWERLAASEEIDVLRRQHAGWYLEWAKEVERHVWGAEAKVAMDRFEREHDNLRAALQFYREYDVSSGRFLASYLHGFWGDRQHRVEGLRWLEDLLDQESDDTKARAAALAALGRLRMGRGDDEGAISVLEEALTILREDDQSRILASALLWLGGALLSVANDSLPRAERLLEESIAVSSAIGDSEIRGTALGYLGHVALLRGDKLRAYERYMEGLSVCRKLGALRGVAWAMRNLAGLARLEGDDCRARKLLIEGLPLAWEVGHAIGIAGSLSILGILAQRRGDHQRAVRLIASATRDSLPVMSPRMDRQERDDSLAASRDALGDEAFAAAWAEGQAMTLEQAVTYALSDNAESLGG